MKLRAIALTAALLVVPWAAADAQTVPSWMQFGVVPTAAEWQAFAASKQDFSGSPNCGTNGCTFTGPIVTTPSTTSAAGINVAPGVAPTSPNNGDFWNTTTGWYFQYNGLTAGPISQQTIHTVEVTVTGVNFNSANSDNSIAIPLLPNGYTRFQVANVMISAASHSLTGATFGLFTAAGGSGTIIASTAITLSATADGTANNYQSTAGPTTESFTQAGFSSLFFRVINAEGATATANVTLRLICLP